MNTSLKTCFKCGHSKPLTEFYKHPHMGDGHLNKCKECTRDDVAQNRAKNIHRIREYDRGRANLPHRIEMQRRVQERWLANFPERRAAQVALGLAVKSGRVKPLPCLVCGEKAEAHHPDYTAPLDVVWLCTAHHRQAHALVKRHSATTENNKGFRQ